MKQLLLCLYLLSPLSVLATPPDHTTLIHRDIDKLVALHTDGFGSNSAKSRHIVFGPLFKPDSQDAVAFFTLNGVDRMNGYEEYIAVFAQGKRRAVTDEIDERPFRLIATALIGTRWNRTFHWGTATISPGQITVQGLRWGSKDAGCCPKVPIEVTFNVKKANGDDTQYPLLRQEEKSRRRK